MLLPLLVGLILSPKPFDFYSQGPYDSSIPRPESILRYGPGERHSTFREQEMVMEALAARAPSRVKVVEYGRTPEGRPLRIYVIGSPKNMGRLDEIRHEHKLLAAGLGDPKRTIPIVWINECIHGDETASFESAMWTAYNLIASRGPRLTHALEHALVVLNPVYNPDGHERYVVYYNSVAVGSPDPQAFERSEPSVIFGRLNHYRFDMNRDRVAFSQDETQAEFAEMLRWNPQVYIDQHGEVKSYFFPPEPMSINQNVDRARNSKWTNVFGRAIAKAFDDNGFSYFVRNTFDLYYPGYIDSSNTLTGAIGMTHETDGGRVLNSLREDGTVLTLRQGMAKHFTSALATVEAAAENGPDLLSSYAEFKRNAVSGKSFGSFRRVVLSSPDPRPLRRLQTQLRSAGIASSFSANPLTLADATDYWTGKAAAKTFAPGALVVDLAQSQGALAKALIEPGQNFEPEFVKNQLGKLKSAPEGETYPGPDDADFYDLTGWSLPYAHDLAAWYSGQTPVVTEAKAPPQSPSATVAAPKSTVGYVVPYTDENDILAVADATSAGLHSLVSTTEMKLGGRKFARGAFLFLADRNDDGYGDRLASIIAARDSAIEPLATQFPDDDTQAGPGSESTSVFRSPKIGVVFGRGENLAQVGGIWFLLERRFRLPFTPLQSTALNGNLSEYTTIIVPRGAGVSVTTGLRDWVSQGGNLVALGGSWALGGGGFVSLDDQKGPLQRLPGSLFRAQIDPRSYLSYGYAQPEGGGPIEIAVPVEGNSFYLRKKEGGSVVTFANDATSKLLSGWEWPDETEKAIRDTVVVQDTSVGRGHVVVFLSDPTDRAMWPGMYKLLLNAMFLGTQ